jgi:RHS repeat-associated protein
VVETRNATSASTHPETVKPHYQYVWSARYVDAPILRDTCDANGNVVAGSRLYYLTDANNNVTAILNSSGAVAERYVYDPYGRLTAYSPAWAARQTPQIDNTYLFAGRELDALTGLYYNRARWYSVDTGGFLGRDPLGYFAGDANMYRYVWSNPGNWVDPSGMLYAPPAGGGGEASSKWDPRITLLGAGSGDATLGGVISEGKRSRWILTLKKDSGTDYERMVCDTPALEQGLIIQLARKWNLHSKKTVTTYSNRPDYYMCEQQAGDLVTYLQERKFKFWRFDQYNGRAWHPLQWRCWGTLGIETENVVIVYPDIFTNPSSKPFLLDPFHGYSNEYNGVRVYPSIKEFEQEWPRSGDWLWTGANVVPRL